METEWECMECGFLHEGKVPPRKCPDCGATGAWEKVEYIEDWDDDDEEESDDELDDEYGE